ncbi:MAG: NrfD/PsrC family molybdoenzyme membrane anchor subunit, partial [Terrimicrobiaceae bacterium]
MAEATTTEPRHPADLSPDERAVQRPPLVLNRRTMGWIGNYVSSIVESKTPLWWWACMAVTTPLALLLFGCIIYLISTGVGVWGNNIPVGWAWDITNFVFWIGIGHAGTLISAILFLTRQKWRTSINRAAEAMTLFAVICAAIYPGFHIGRVWMAWFMAPVPNSNGIWQNFRSPLLWDVFAVGTYFTVSVLFWYTGLIPDLATLRDRATTKIRKFAYGVLALGWRGSNRHWRHYEMAYLLLAGLSTPLVLSVHSVVSFDFATSVIP